VQRKERKRNKLDGDMAVRSLLNLLKGPSPLCKEGREEEGGKRPFLFGPRKTVMTGKKTATAVEEFSLEKRETLRQYFERGGEKKGRTRNTIVQQWSFSRNPGAPNRRIGRGGGRRKVNTCKTKEGDCIAKKFLSLYILWKGEAKYCLGGKGGRGR